MFNDNRWRVAASSKVVCLSPVDAMLISHDIYSSEAKHIREPSQASAAESDDTWERAMPEVRLLFPRTRTRSSWTEYSALKHQRYVLGVLHGIRPIRAILRRQSFGLGHS